MNVNNKGSTRITTEQKNENPIVPAKTQGPLEKKVQGIATSTQERVEIPPKTRLFSVRVLKENLSHFLKKIVNFVKQCFGFGVKKQQLKSLIKQNDPELAQATRDILQGKGIDKKSITILHDADGQTLEVNSQFASDFFRDAYFLDGELLLDEKERKIELNRYKQIKQLIDIFGEQVFQNLSLLLNQATVADLYQSVLLSLIKQDPRIRSLQDIPHSKAYYFKHEGQQIRITILSGNQTLIENEKSEIVPENKYLFLRTDIFIPAKDLEKPINTKEDAAKTRVHVEKSVSEIHDAPEASRAEIFSKNEEKFFPSGK